MRRTGIGQDGDAQALGPGPYRQLPDLPLPAGEPPFAFGKVENKALEVSEVIEDDAGDLAGVFFPAVLAAMAMAASRVMAVAAWLFSGITRKRWSDLRSLAPKAVDPGDEQAEIALDHRIPPAGLGHGGESGLDDRQRGLLRAKHV